MSDRERSLFISYFFLFSHRTPVFLDVLFLCFCFFGVAFYWRVPRNAKLWRVRANCTHTHSTSNRKLHVHSFRADVFVVPFSASSLASRRLFVVVRLLGALVSLLFFALARSLTHSLSFTPPHLSLWRANFSLSVQKTVLLDCPHKRSSTRRGGGGGGKNKVKMAHLFTA